MFNPTSWGPLRFILVVLAVVLFRFMLQLITILNRCHRFRGFLYHRATFSPDHKSIEVSVRSRQGSAAICSRCHQPARGYDQLAERRFEFIPLRGFFVFLLYACALSIAAGAAPSSWKKFPGATASVR
jgi:hypothetical protein